MVLDDRVIQYGEGDKNKKLEQSSLLSLFEAEAVDNVDFDDETTLFLDQDDDDDDDDAEDPRVQ
jgi:hypothetical protein